MIVENTFLVKVSDNYYIVLVVSSAYNKPNQPSVYQQYKGATIEIQYGFLGSIMNEVVDHMKGANNHTANNNQYNMIKEYVGTFSDGDMEKHKESQRWWIQDKGPIIETNIGFVETYLDAQGVRAEWEGMVAIVDKERSKLLAKLVELAEEINTELPWPNDYEKDTFLRPDFTDLAVLTFAGSGTPIGINIPNYDDIRMNFGFKNVNLGNVAGTMKKESLICMSDQYKDIIVPNHSASLFVDVACHELLGHGSGKLLQEQKDGTLNFDLAVVKNPFTKEAPKSWYKAAETWSSVFGDIASSWEECRAECVALYLPCFDRVMDVLVPGKEAEYDGILKTTWLTMIYGGLKGMMMYNAEAGKWGQAHCRARFFICKWLQKKGFLSYNFFEKDGKDYFEFTMDLDNIKTDGFKYIGEALVHLQVMKAEANITEGRIWWEKWTALDKDDLRMRSIILSWKRPRSLELQHDVQLANGNVEHVSFEESHEGLIKSYLTHYQHNFDNVFEEYQRWKNMFRR